jgi:hypothetical protein
MSVRTWAQPSSAIQTNRAVHTVPRWPNFQPKLGLKCDHVDSVRVRMPSHQRYLHTLFFHSHTKPAGVATQALASDIGCPCHRRPRLLKPMKELTLEKRALETKKTRWRSCGVNYLESACLLMVVLCRSIVSVLFFSDMSIWSYHQRTHRFC